MSDASTRRECPRCGSIPAMMNGPRDDRQQYRCRSRDCGLQFIDRKEPYYQRFRSEVIARAIELRLQGMQYEEVAAEVRREFSKSRTKISAKTVLRWFEKYVNIAFGEVRKLPIKKPEILVVEYASLYPPNGGCWVVWDFYTSYVLATVAGSPFDPVAAREAIAKSEAPIGPLTEKVREFTFWTDENSGNPEACSDVLAAIKEQLRGGHYIPPEAIGLINLFLKLGSKGAFLQPLRTMQKRKAFRSRESRQLFLDGWVVRHNFFARPDGPDVHIPADSAGVKAPFSSWLDVVNHRVKVLGQRRGEKKKVALAGSDGEISAGP